MIDSDQDLKEWFSSVENIIKFEHLGHHIILKTELAPSTLNDFKEPHGVLFNLNINVVSEKWMDNLKTYLVVSMPKPNRFAPNENLFNKEQYSDRIARIKDMQEFIKNQFSKEMQAQKQSIINIINEKEKK